MAWDKAAIWQPWEKCQEVAGGSTLASLNLWTNTSNDLFLSFLFERKTIPIYLNCYDVIFLLLKAWCISINHFSTTATNTWNNQPKRKKGLFWLIVSKISIQDCLTLWRHSASWQRPVHLMAAEKQRDRQEGGRVSTNPSRPPPTNNLTSFH
jgi:hypothetical protein